jgi:hypothetical protein
MSRPRPLRKKVYEGLTRMRRSPWNGGSSGQSLWSVCRQDEARGATPPGTVGVVGSHCVCRPAWRVKTCNTCVGK